MSRDERDHRCYGTETVAVLEALACLRSAGMSVGDMRHYLSLLGRGDEASAQQRDLFARHAGQLAAEIGRLRVRLRYLQLKSGMWDARNRGDAAAEEQAIAGIVRIAHEF